MDDCSDRIGRLEEEDGLFYNAIPAEIEAIQDGLKSHMEANGIAKFKWPERIEFIQALPRTETGKIQKFKLRDDVREKLKEEAR